MSLKSYSAILKTWKLQNTPAEELRLNLARSWKLWDAGAVK